MVKVDKKNLIGEQNLFEKIAEKDPCWSYIFILTKYMKTRVLEIVIFFG